MIECVSSATLFYDLMILRLDWAKLLPMLFLFCIRMSFLLIIFTFLVPTDRLEFSSLLARLSWLISIFILSLSSSLRESRMKSLKALEEVLKKHMLFPLMLLGLFALFARRRFSWSLWVIYDLLSIRTFCLFSIWQVWSWDLSILRN